MHDRPPLFFLHIPRTAGTTLAAILQRQFSRSEICSFWHWTEVLRASRKELGKYRIFTNEFGYYFCRFLPFTPAVLTFLRDPVERTLSWYEYVRRYETHPLNARVRAHKGFDEFVTDPECRILIENYQTRYIAHDVDKDRLLQYAETEVSVTSHGQMTMDLMSLDQAPEHELFERAKKRLEEMAFVGVTERFPESLFLIAQQFGWGPMRAYETKHVTANRVGLKDVSPATRDKLEELVRYDRELHQHALRILEERLSHTVHELLKLNPNAMCTQLVSRSPGHSDSHEPQWSPEGYRAELAILEEREYERKCAQLPRRSSVRFSFDEPIPGTGWKEVREVTAGGIAPFCWTGPQTVSTLNFHVAKDRDLRVTITALSAVGPDVLMSLKLRVNDMPIDLEISPDGGCGATYRGIIPRRALQHDKPLTCLTFSVNRTSTAREAFGLDGDLPLGIAFSRITLIPTGLSGVTVVIKRSGHASYLREALESVQRQTARDAIDQIIVWDDTDLPVTWPERMPPVIGLARLAEVRDVASSPLVAFLHDNDWWSADHIEMALAALKANKHCVAVFSEAYEADSPRYPMMSTSPLSWPVWMCSGFNFQPAVLVLDEGSVMLSCLLDTSFSLSSLVGRSEAVWKALFEMEAAGAGEQAEGLLPVFLISYGHIGYRTVPGVFHRRHTHYPRSAALLLRVKPAAAASAVKRFDEVVGSMSRKELTLLSTLFDQHLPEPHRTWLTYECGLKLDSIGFWKRALRGAIGCVRTISPPVLWTVVPRFAYRVLVRAGLLHALGSVLMPQAGLAELNEQSSVCSAPAEVRDTVGG